jgi:hypothetical protein
MTLTPERNPASFRPSQKARPKMCDSNVILKNVLNYLKMNVLNTIQKESADN